MRLEIIKSISIKKLKCGRIETQVQRQVAVTYPKPKSVRPESCSSYLRRIELLRQAKGKDMNSGQ